MCDGVTWYTLGAGGVGLFSDDEEDNDLFMTPSAPVNKPLSISAAKREMSKDEKAALG